MIPNWVAAIEKRIEANGGKYIAGKSITIADFALSSVFFNFLMNEANPHYSETLNFIKDDSIINKYVNGLK